MAGDADDFLATWATRIAEHAVPHEVDVAPAMAAAFVRGGRDRDDLFRRGGAGQPGGFGAGFPVALFPLILQGLEAVARWAPALLDSDALGNLLASGQLLLMLRSGGDAPAAPGPAATPTAEVERHPTLRVAARLSAELVDAGVDPAQATDVACAVLEALSSDPEGGAELVERLGQRPGKRPGRRRGRQRGRRWWRAWRRRPRS